MPNANEILLSQLLKVRTGKEVERQIEAHTRKMQWVPFAGQIGNKSQIKLGKDSIRALVERTTNGIDAVVERKLLEMGISGADFPTPYDAVTALFPDLDSRLEMIYVQVDYLAREKGFSTRGVVDVMDYGTGIEPQQFPTTILSLSGNNKIGKLYSMGTYGHGGAASIGFVNQNDGYVVIASRTATSDAGFTIIRHHAPDATDKRGWYEYLVDANGEILTVKVPLPKQRGKNWGGIPTTIYDIPQGTLVRHFEYDLSGYSSKWSNTDGGIIAAFNTYLFNPLIPPHLNAKYHSRKMADTKSQNARKVWGIARQLEEGEVDGTVEYGSPASELSLTLNGEKQGTINVRYSVLAAGATGKIPLAKRGKSVVSTYNGQTHDARSLDDISPKIRDAYPHLHKDLIVEVRVDGLSREALDNLLASDREEFQNAECYQQIRKIVLDLILDDEQLNEINQSRYEKSLVTGKKITLTTAAKYLLDFIKCNLAYGDVAGGGVQRVRKPASPPVPIKLRKDAPSFVRFATDTIHFNLASPNRYRYLTIETDAPNGYRLPDIEFAGEGDRFLKYEVIAPLHQGRLRIRVDITGGQDGYIGEAIVHYNATVRQTVMYAFIDQKAVRTPKAIIKGTGTQMGIPDVTFVEVNPRTCEWKETLGLTGQDAKIFAFRPVKNGDQLAVYWNNEFPVYVRTMVDVTSEAEVEHVKYHLENGLAVQALYGAGDGAGYPISTPEIEASRCAAMASAIVLAKELLNTKKRKGASAGR
jgi:hypothetical protein